MLCVYSIGSSNIQVGQRSSHRFMFHQRSLPLVFAVEGFRMHSHAVISCVLYHNTYLACSLSVQVDVATVQLL